MAFETGDLALECTWATIILLTNGGGKYRSVEVICKAITVIIDWSLAGAVEFHDVLHGFRGWRGT